MQASICSAFLALPQHRRSLSMLCAFAQQQAQQQQAQNSQLPVQQHMQPQQPVAPEPARPVATPWMNSVS